MERTKVLFEQGCTSIQIRSSRVDLTSRNISETNAVLIEVESNVELLHEDVAENGANSGTHCKYNVVNTNPREKKHERHQARSGDASQKQKKKIKSTTPPIPR
jgi:hypothetical protein